MADYTKKTESSEVKTLELSFGDYIKAGRTGLTGEETQSKQIYRTSRNICLDTINSGYSSKKRVIAPAAMVLAGRNEDVFISKGDAANAFGVELTEVKTMLSEIKSRLDKDYDFTTPSVEAYFLYLIETAEEENLIESEEKAEIRDTFNSVKNYLDQSDDERVKFHHNYAGLTGKTNRSLAAGFLEYITKYMIGKDNFDEDRYLTQQDIAQVAGTYSRTIREVREAIERIPLLKKHKERVKQNRERLADLYKSHNELLEEQE